jgi:hypothetical protein
LIKTNYKNKNPVYLIRWDFLYYYNKSIKNNMENIKQLKEDIQEYFGSRVEVIITSYPENHLLMSIKSKSHEYLLSKKFIDAFIYSFKDIEYRGKDSTDFERSIKLQVNYQKLNNNLPCIYMVSFII